LSEPARRVPCERVAGHPEFRSLASIMGLRVDLRYASANNFVGRDLYGQLNCSWLHRDAAAGLERAIAWLRVEAPGMTLLVLDALRPHRVQVELWDFLEGTDLRQYLADPARGSIHSYGMAVDVTLLDALGAELDMGTGFDDLTDLSHPKYEARYLAEGAMTQAQVANRVLLRNAMLQAGFHGISTEWWHFDFGDRDKVRANYLRVE
jgi:D-alanyl-D-alanine dipeptidase